LPIDDAQFDRECGVGQPAHARFVLLRIVFV
jgi:hypothetical protein